MGVGVLGPPSADDPGPFEPPRVSAAVTVVIAVAALVLLTTPMAVGINPAATLATFVERATPATVAIVLARTDEPEVADTVCVTVWVRTLELAWATCVMVWVTLEAPATRLTVWVTAVGAVDTAEPEALLAAWETVLVTAAAALSSAGAGTGPASRAVPVLAVPALSTAPAVGVEILVAGTVAVGAGDVAAGVTGAVEETSCVVVVTTLPRAPVAGVAAPDSSATASDPGSAHRTAAVISRALHRPGSRGEGL